MFCFLRISSRDERVERRDERGGEGMRGSLMLIFTVCGGGVWGWSVRYCGCVHVGMRLIRYQRVQDCI